METKVSDIQYLIDRMAIQELNSDFFQYLDHSDFAKLLDLFCDDAIYSHGSRVSTGKIEIASLFNARGKDKTRTVRHLYSNLKIEFIDNHHATGQSVCLTFGADAEAPINSAEPYLVAVFSDRYERNSNGQWRISSRHIERIFVAQNNSGPEGMAPT